MMFMVSPAVSVAVRVPFSMPVVSQTFLALSSALDKYSLRCHNGRMDEKRKAIYFAIDTEVYEKLKTIAHSKGMLANPYVRQLVTRHVARSKA